MNTLTLDKDTVRLLTKGNLKLAVLEFGKNNPGKGSFILSDVIGTRWDAQFVPFYTLYNENGKVAGQEMGKLLSRVGDELGLKAVKENRFGKKDAINRYFF